MAPRRAEQVARLILAEEPAGSARSAGRHGNPGTDGAARVEGGQRHLGERHQKPAIGNVVAGGDPPALDLAPHEIAVAPLGGEVDRRRRPLLPALDLALVEGAGEMATGAAHQQQRLVRRLEGRVARPLEVGDQAEAADRRRRQDARALGLVVEGDVAGDDREIQRPAGVGHALDAAHELAHDVRPLGVAEVEAVGDGERPRAHGGEVAPRLGDRLRTARGRIGGAVAGRAIGGERQALARSVDPDHGGVATRRLHRVGHHHVVVLLPDPALGAEIGRGEEPLQRLHGIGRGRLVVGRACQRRGPRCEFVGPLVDGCLVHQRAHGQIAHHGAARLQHEAARLRHPADDGEVDAPFLEDGAGLFRRLGADHHEHPLLTLGEHDLVGGHGAFAHRHLVEVELDPGAALVRHLHRGAGEPRRAHILDGDDGVRRHQGEAGLHEQLLGKGVADLHGGALLFRALAEGGGRHGGTVDAVAPGLGADIDHGIADRVLGGGIEDAVGRRHAHGHGVDQDVAVVSRIEGARAADRRHADAVAVAADAGDHTRHQMARLGVAGRTEAERIEARHRPRAHGEHVAQDAADTGRSSLIGLDEGRVVVALHLEDRRLPVADIHHAGVLPRPADDPGRLGRQLAQPHPRGLVGAVLVPHRREDAELRQVGRPPHDPLDAGILVRAQPMLGDERRRDRHVRHRAHRAAHESVSTR